MNEINKIFDIIDSAIEQFQGNIPVVQRKIFDEIILLSKDLAIRNGRILNNIENFNVLSKIRQKIESIIINKSYKSNVSRYIKAFNEVSNFQNSYFEKSFNKKLGNKELLREIRYQSINSTLDYLTEAGINTNIISKVEDIIRQNIASGGNFSNYTEQLRNYIVSDKNGIGALERYTKQITTDALNQYSRQYMNTITNDLYAEWYMYVGSLKETSRPFCEFLNKKKYIHKSELKTIITNNIDGVNICSEDIPCNPKTKLPQGMIPGTNEFTILTYAGGYECGHKFVPVHELAVPIAIRNKVYNSSEYIAWAKQNKKTKI